jgi:hypothetical protein
MAKVWFVRRNGAEWVAPGGAPVYQAPLDDLIFKLDLGPQRWLSHERPSPTPELPREDPQSLTKVMIETGPGDVAGQTLTAYKVGFYDSPYPPGEVARRLGLTGR